MALRISDVESRYNDAQKSVATKKQNWINLNLDNYQYNFWRGCMVSMSYTVIKKDGLFSYTDIVGRSRVKDLDLIEDVFDELIVAYKVAKKVEVRWSDLGYPLAVSIDWSDAIDDECRFVIKEFKNIEI